MNDERKIAKVLETSIAEDSIQLVSLGEENEPFNSPYFSGKKDHLYSFLNIHSSSESSNESLQFRNLEKTFRSSQIIDSDIIIVRGWKNIENISARLIEIYDYAVILECLIDKEQGIYEEREFRSSLFSIEDLKIGNLFYLRIFEKENESRIEIHNDPKLTFIEDFPKIEFKKLFEESKLFKKKS